MCLLLNHILLWHLASLIKFILLLFLTIVVLFIVVVVLLFFLLIGLLLLASLNRLLDFLISQVTIVVH